MSDLAATVVITTHNRKEELIAAIQSALSQTARPEVLVMDDASTDGTAELIAERFATVRLERSPVSRGYIIARNRAAAIARGPIIFSLDDDAAFASPHTVEQTLAEFDHRRVGAVAIPFIDVRQSPQVRQLAPAGSGIFAAMSYMGTAHAVRRDLFLSLGGYNEILFHQGEERDFCLRMLDGGFVVRLGRADPIHHFESPRRDFRRRDLYGRRNEILFDWHNVPMPYFPSRLLATTLSGIRFGVGCGRPLRMVHGLMMGYSALFKDLRGRRPVSRQTYRLARMLSRRGAAPLEEIEPMLAASPQCGAPVNGSNSAITT